jgi:protein-tyrosine phosphatase
MTDLHTHILPGMDDGAKDASVSLAMLREEARQGVDTVVLTPHFYRSEERPTRFLARRQQAMWRLEQALEELPEEERDSLPRLLLGAEVAWVPNLADLVELADFTLGESRYVLIELPFTPWDSGLVNQLYAFPGCTGLTPVFAHLERYRRQRKDLYQEILNMGMPAQVSAGEVTRLLSSGMNLLRQRRANIVASDCHNMADRAPNLGAAMDVITKKLGASEAENLNRWAERIATDCFTAERRADG